MSVRVVFLSPGSGLGHLVRACALASHLDARGVTTCIVGTSRFAAALQALTGHDIIGLRQTFWREEVPILLETLAPDLVVVDTFPAGFRGEWLDPGLRKRWRRCYLARRIRLEAYARALDRDLEAIRQAVPDEIILLESLGPAQQAFLEASGSRLHPLPGPVRYKQLRVPPVPDPLEALLNTGRLRLVVHSGPAEEVRTLIDRAKADSSRGDAIAAVAPLSKKAVMQLSVPVFDYFPASVLYSRAFHLYTGAGYNTMAECSAFRNKHTVVPFFRRYDDQAGRARVNMPDVDGSQSAASTVEMFL